MRALSPLTLIGVFAFGAAITLVHGALPVFSDNVTLELLVAVSLLIAASSFDKEDPPRAAWWTLAAAVILLLVGHAATPFTPNKTMSVRHIMTFSHNAVWVAALLRFAWIVRGSGLRPRESRRVRATFVALGVVVASVAGYALVRLFGGLVAQPDPPLHDISVTFVNASGAVADALVFMIAVYLARALAPMRQGAVVQPYLLLALGACSLLALDVGAAAAGLHTYLGNRVFEYVHSFAWTCVGAAGLSQAALVRRAAKASEPAPG